MRCLLPILLFCGLSVFAADNLIPAGSFESPLVSGRTPMGKGGDPSNGGRGPEWVGFKIESTGTNGMVSGGLTNEISRSGKQSLFINFENVSAPYEAVSLTSRFIPVVSGTQYTVGIWGRTDAKDLINADGRSAYLKLEVDFFANDASTSVGDPVYSVQPLPGGKGRKPFFSPDKWTQFFFHLMSPPEAAYAQITWRWETGSNDGSINGIMYFDDPNMIGPVPAAQADPGASPPKQP